jgi:heme A synthase
MLDTTTTSTTTSRSTARTVFVSLVGLSGLLVLLQGLWAGLFIHEGRDYQQSWVDVHARGADLAIALTVVAAVLAWVKLRERRDLTVGTTIFAVLLVLEAWLGGRIGSSPGTTAVHVPLAMALMALSVWLPLRATNR